MSPVEINLFSVPFTIIFFCAIMDVNVLCVSNPVRQRLGCFQVSTTCFSGSAECFNQINKRTGEVYHIALMSMHLRNKRKVRGIGVIDRNGAK